MPKIKILIAGYTGFIGFHLVKRLKLDATVSLILLSRSNGFNLTEGTKLRGIDCDIVINLSGVVGIDCSWKNPNIFYRDNYLITLNLLEAARANNAHFIQISSYVYGIPEYQPIDENHQVKGYNPYASSKILSEELCKDYANYYQVPVTILRPFNIYGEGQSDQFLISKLINASIKEVCVDIYDLDAKRDYLWIGDFINGMIKVIKKEQKGIDVYNIGSGVSYSAQDIISIISTYSTPVIYTSESDGSKLLIKDCVCDNGLFSKKFDWSPGVSLKSGVQNLVNYIK
jgi:nucleoside-diphosphate-sugar epimerase